MVSLKHLVSGFFENLLTGWFIKCKSVIKSCLILPTVGAIVQLHFVCVSSAAVKLAYFSLLKPPVEKSVFI